MSDFSSYSFNASHAVCYSYVTCMTAWLAAYYPLEFFAALLTIDSGNTDDIRRYIKAVKDRGFDISTPDINRSDLDFVISDKSIVFGLSGIKGVGAAVSKKIMKKKPKAGYKSFGQFIVKNLDLLNSKIIESYTKAGAFKSLGVNKDTIISSNQRVLDFMSTYRDCSNHYTIFDKCGIKLEDHINKCILIPSEKEDDIIYEIDSLGLYITKHPMDDYIINKDRATDVRRLSEFEHEDEFITVGAISGIEVKKTKAKTNMCYFNITTSTHSAKCICFARDYARHMDTIEEGKLVTIVGKIKEEEAGKVLIVMDIKDNFNPFVCVLHKPDNTVKFEDIRSLSSLTKEFVGVRINNRLKFILHKS